MKMILVVVRDICITNNSCFFSILIWQCAKILLLFRWKFICVGQYRCAISHTRSIYNNRAHIWTRENTMAKEQCDIWKIVIGRQNRKIKMNRDKIMGPWNQFFFPASTREILFGGVFVRKSSSFLQQTQSCWFQMLCCRFIGELLMVHCT